MSSVIRNFLFIFSGSFLNILLGLFTTPIITRIVYPDDYGNWSIFNIVANLVFMLFGLGFDQVLVRYFYKYDDIDYHRCLLKKCVRMPLAFLFSFFIPLFVIYWLVLDQHVFDISTYLIFFVYVLFLIINRISFLLLRFVSKIKLYSFLTVLHKLSYVVFALLFLLSNQINHFTSLILATSISTIFVTIISVWKESNRWKIWKISNNSFFLPNKELFSYGFPLMLASSVYMIFQAVDKLMLKSLSSSYEVGIYASAASLIALFSIVQTSFNTLWWPAVMSHYEKYKQDTSYYIQGNATISLIMFVLGGLLVSLKDVFVLLLGENYRSASSIVPFLMFQPIMYTISETTVVGLTIEKKSKYQLFIIILSCLCNIMGNLLLIPIWGTVGAAVSTGISYIVFWALRTYFSNKFFKVEYQFLKMILCIILLFAFSVYSSVFDNLFFNLLFLLVYVLVVLFLYRESLIYIFKMFFSEEKNFLC